MMPITKHFNHKQRRVTNGPTAAVIRYDEEGGAPKVVAQGKGQVANQIIELAQQNNIHMIWIPTNASRLSSIECQFTHLKEVVIRRRLTMIIAAYSEMNCSITSCS